METGERYSDISSRHFGVGCLVGPVMFFGTLLMMEDGGPPGPFGFAQFFGWWATCSSVVVLSARLADRWRNGAPRRHALLLASLALPFGMTGLFIYWVHPTTPGSVKDFLVHSHQAIGLVAIGLAIGWLFRTGWRSHRR